MKQLCSECEVHTYNPETDSFCEDCTTWFATHDGEYEWREALAETLAAHTDSLLDSVKDGDISMAQARANYSHILKRRP